MSMWKILVGEEETPLLLEMFKLSQFSRLLVKNAFYKGLKNPLWIPRWQRKWTFSSEYLYTFRRHEFIGEYYIFVIGWESPQTSNWKVNVGNKRASSHQGSESALNTARGVNTYSPQWEVITSLLSRLAKKLSGLFHVVSWSVKRN